MWLIARILYAAARGVLYGAVPGAVVGLMVAVGILAVSRTWPADWTKLLGVVAGGFFTAPLGGALIGLFLPHDPARGDLGLMRRDRRVAVPAALLGLAGALAWHVFELDVIRAIRDVAWTELTEPVFAHWQILLAGAAGAACLGALLPPPKVLVLLALNQFTIVDVLRRAHPHHDEEVVRDLPAPEHGRLHAQAAVWWSYRGQAPRARHEWSEARRLGGMTEEDYVLCASFYDATDQADEAERVLREALQRFERSVQLRYALTDALEHQQLTAETEVEYRRILALDPNFAPAHHAYGRNLFDQTRYDEALEHFTRAVELTADDQDSIARYLNSRGALYGQTGQFEIAERDFRRAVRLGYEIRCRTGKTPDGLKEAVRNLGMLHGMRLRR